MTTSTPTKPPFLIAPLSCLAVALLTFTPSHAQANTSSKAPPPSSEVKTQWISFGQHQDDATTKAKVLSSNRSGIRTSVTPPGVELATSAAEDGAEYTKLHIPGCGLSADHVGQPNMPFRGFFLEIPYGVNVSVEVPEQDIESLGFGYRVHPRQPPMIDSVDEKPPFTVDENSYATDDFFPPSPVVIEEPGFIRGRRVVWVQAYPLRYNPVTTELQAYTELRFNLVYEGEIDARGERERKRLASPDLEGVAESFIINSEPVLERGVGRRMASKGQGADYLFLVKDNLQEEIQPLVNWKQQKGYSTFVATRTTVGGGTPSKIKSYIQNAYDNWDPAPSYVLIVGDHEDFNAKLVYLGSPPSYPYQVQTDIDYACLQGSDYYPDIAIGRLPVRTETDCENVVDKILDYDKTPADENWYSHFLSAGYFQDGDRNNDSDGEADRWFMETSVHVTKFLDSLWFPGFTIHTAWCTNSDWTGTMTYNADSYPHRFSYPSQVPQWVMDEWYDDPDDASDAVTSVINSGVGHILHRDHGGEEAWGDPPFKNSDINNLTNSHKTPVVFSINCLTGSFQQTDGDCFCEAFIKKSPGGCVGIVGATRVSFSGWNDLLVNGLYDSFYNDYDKNHTDTTCARSRRPAVALNYGKYYMKTYEPSDNLLKSEFYMFHYFGDPEMKMRTVNPALLVVDITADWVVQGLGQIEMGVHSGAGPSVNARVTIGGGSKGAGDMWVGITDESGTVVFPDISLPPGSYTITVTGEDTQTYSEQFDIMKGACCENNSGSCIDGVGPLDCVGRWSTRACEDLEPPCGTGACCRSEGNFCEYTPPWMCDGLDDMWLGFMATCDDCCDVDCPPGGIIEAEQCGEATNDGCDGDPEAFENILCGDVFCGTLWADAGDNDRDWFEFTLVEPSTITATIDGEMPIRVEIMEQVEWGSSGCANTTGSVAWIAVSARCNQASVTSGCLPPGVYYIRVTPDVVDGFPCNALGYGNDYTLSVACEICDATPGACCDDYADLCAENVYEVNCQEPGQRFLPGGTCAGFDPPCGSRGACCYDQNGTCLADVPEAYCLAPEYRFLASPATCDDFDPPCGTPFGVCCGPEVGQCIAGAFETECQEPGEVFLGSPATCDDCEGAVAGVCCDDSLGICEVDTFEFNCRMPWQRFLASPAICADFYPPCGPAWGACCLEDGSCDDGQYEVDCQEEGMRFAPGEVCDALDPPCGETACCLEDGGCLVMTPDECSSPPFNGIPQQPGTACDHPVACCFDDGSCLDLDQLCCEELGGWAGYDELCQGDANGDDIDDSCEDPGDLDNDGDVDLDDYAIFQNCLAGPEVFTPPIGCTAIHFAEADLTGDGDVDLEDFTGLQIAFTGPGEPEVFYPTDDAMIDQYSPNNNFGSSVSMGVRNRDGGSPTWEDDTLMRFDLSAIPAGTSIASATLHLYYAYYWDSPPQGRDLTCHRVTSTWSEGTVTWNTRPSHAPTVTSSDAVPASTGQWMSWDVTVDVQDFVDGFEPNYGWIIMDEVPWGSGSIPFTWFRSKEFGDFTPYLSIE